MSQTEPYGISALSEQGKTEAFTQINFRHFRNAGKQLIIDFVSLDGNELVWAFLAEE